MPRQGIVANTLNLFRHGASLLAKAFGVGFIDWLGLLIVVSEAPVFLGSPNNAGFPGIVAEIEDWTQTQRLTQQLWKQGEKVGYFFFSCADPLLSFSSRDVLRKV